MVMAQNLSMEAAIGTLLRLKRASGWRVPLAKSGSIGATVEIECTRHTHGLTTT